jgi:hypothetical protein
MGFNRRKLEAEQRHAAEKKAVERRATDVQVLKDAERLVAAWNERQAKRMPMLFSPTIGAAVAAGYWFLWVTLSGVPDNQRRRSAHARPPPGRGRDESHSSALLPPVPTERTVR